MYRPFFYHQLSALRLILLILAYLYLFHAPSLRAQQSLPAYTPPHILKEITISDNEISPRESVRSLGLNLASILILLTTYQASYFTLSFVVSPPLATPLSEVATRGVDFLMDSMTSHSASELAARSALSNMDIIPGLAGLPWIVRRLASAGYALREPLSRFIPWSSVTPTAFKQPTLMYMHSFQLNALVKIVLVPAALAEKHGSSLGAHSFFVINVEPNIESCQVASASSPLTLSLHQLACQMPDGSELSFHVYPISQGRQNRLYLQPVMNQKTGPLFESPYDYGDSSQVRFLSEFEEQDRSEPPCPSLEGEEPLNDSSSDHCTDSLHWKLANPLHETTFQLLEEVLASSHGLWEGDIDTPKGILSQPRQLPELSGHSGSIITSALESQTLTLVSAGENAVLFRDWKNNIFSLATQTDLSEVSSESLQYLDQRRPGTLHNLSKLGYEILYLAAVHYLTSKLVYPALNSWLKAIFAEGDSETVDLKKPQQKGKQAAPGDGDGDGKDKDGKEKGDQKKSKGSASSSMLGSSSLIRIKKKKNKSGFQNAGYDSSDDEDSEPPSPPPVKTEDSQSSLPDDDAATVTVKKIRLEGDQSSPTVTSDLEDDPSGRPRKSRSTSPAGSTTSTVRDSAPLTLTIAVSEERTPPKDDTTVDTQINRPGSGQPSPALTSIASPMSSAGYKFSPSTPAAGSTTPSTGKESVGTPLSTSSATGVPKRVLERRKQRRRNTGKWWEQMASDSEIRESYKSSPVLSGVVEELREIKKKEESEDAVLQIYRKLVLAEHSPSNTVHSATKKPDSPATPLSISSPEALTSVPPSTTTKVPDELLADLEELPSTPVSPVRSQRTSPPPEDETVAASPMEVTDSTSGEKVKPVTPPTSPMLTRSKKRKTDKPLEGTEPDPDITETEPSLVVTLVRPHKEDETSPPSTKKALIDDGEDKPPVTKFTMNTRRTTRDEPRPAVKVSPPASPEEKEQQTTFEITSSSQACMVHGCGKMHATPEEEWSHHRQAHVIEPYFGQKPSDMSMGNKLVAYQGDTNCRVPGCRTRKHDSLGAMTTHLTDKHSTVLDEQKFNTYWQSKLNVLKNDVLELKSSPTKKDPNRVKCGHCKKTFTHTSDHTYYVQLLQHTQDEHKELSKGKIQGFQLGIAPSTQGQSGLAKQYQSRYGDGWHCHECRDPHIFGAEGGIGQSPEKLGEHWRNVHFNKDSYWCYYRDCRGEDNTRSQFTTPRDWYLHMMTHRSEELLDIEPGTGQGWLNQDDIFPFTVWPTAKKRK